MSSRTDEELRRLCAERLKYETTAEMARALDMKRQTLSHLLHEAASRGLVVGWAVEMPEMPADDIEPEQIIDMMVERFTARMDSAKAHTWFPITIKDKKPIGIFWFGDPHIDDNGCDWPSLRRHVKLCRETDGMYAANIGDTTNNWTGRLCRLYANQDTSVKTARTLAEWFMLDAGIRWLLWILGNHDTWNDGAEVLAQMGRRFGTHKLICHDWEVRFTLRFQNGWEPRIFASHDFKGTSIWNPFHGPMREGQLGEDADLYICGHKHEAGKVEFENVARGHFQHFVRVRGYKFMDEHARRHGYKEQRKGCSAVTVFDPTTRSISVHSDVEEGARYLTYLRSGGA